MAKKKAARTITKARSAEKPPSEAEAASTLAAPENRPTPPVSISKYTLAATVAPHIEILEVKMLESMWRRRLVDDKLPGQVKMDYKTWAKADSDKERLEVCATLEVSGQYEGQEQDKGADVPFRIQAVFQLIYAVKSPITFSEEQLAAFGEFNGIYNAWPYWREYVHSTTVRMGLPPMVVPVYLTSLKA